jgi:hypothetical protein
MCKLQFIQFCVLITLFQMDNVSIIGANIKIAKTFRHVLRSWYRVPTAQAHVLYSRHQLLRRRW